MDQDITLLINQSLDDQLGPRDQVVPLVYEELKKIAMSLIVEKGQTISSTVLVHEVFVKIFSGSQERRLLQSRKHFYCMASRVMRQILVDQYRKKVSSKRSASLTSVDFADIEDVIPNERKPSPVEDLMGLDQALSELAQLDEQKARLVELKYFGGLTNQEIADTLEISLAKVKRDWDFAKTWLFRKLSTYEKTSGGK